MRILVNGMLNAHAVYLISTFLSFLRSVDNYIVTVKEIKNNVTQNETSNDKKKLNQNKPTESGIMTADEKLCFSFSLFNYVVK